MHGKHAYRRYYYSTSSDDEDSLVGTCEEDLEWMNMADVINTWDVNISGTLISKRQRFQNRPVEIIDVSSGFL
jgi:hypothetical protein